MKLVGIEDSFERDAVTKRLDIIGAHMHVMGDAGELREDMALPSGALGKEIRKKFENDEDIFVSTSPYHSLFGSSMLYALDCCGCDVRSELVFSSVSIS